MVGAVLVHDGRIIGEGYHREFGKAHAEVNCIESVGGAEKHLIPDSTLYVNLEPCTHFGKTPPCTDLIIKNNIPNVVVGTVDPFEQVDGTGIERLRQAGVEVITGILETECENLNRRFFMFQTKHRPFIILKWAQTADNKIAGIGDKRLLISGRAYKSIGS
jgi:diaminohydroxyphosphoribosylaminopyrimidine deaminase/5-amino-6-(5-phosphoribosylamino)uracil reductase